MKIKYLLLALIVLAGLFSCDKKDDQIPVINDSEDPMEDPGIVDTLPSSFDVSIDSISFNSAVVLWTRATSAIPNTISYSVYLNDELLIESSNDTIYRVENLTELTTYSIKVEAENTIGKQEVVENFTTLNKVDTLPSVFEITIDSISFNSAVVLWTRSTSAIPNTIYYSVYLDNELLVENSNDTIYRVENLTGLTTYSIKVQAVNTIGIQEVVENFATPGTPKLRLIEQQKIRVDNPTNRSINTITYNENNQIVRRYKRWDQLNIDLEEYEYTYNSKGLLSSERIRLHHTAGGTSGQALYTYNGGQLETLTLNEGYGDFYVTISHSFQTPINYTFIRRTEDGNGPPNITNHEVSLILDANENLTEYRETNTTAGTSIIYSFEYENENLVKVTIGNNVLEISYDDANNLHTYPSQFSQYENQGYIEHCGFFDNFIRQFQTMQRIPYFFTYNNKNNPVEYKLNGQIIQTYQYEYNEYNYPSRIDNLIEFGNPKYMTLSYEEFE